MGGKIEKSQVTIKRDKNKIGNKQGGNKIVKLE